MLLHEERLIIRTLCSLKSLQRIKFEMTTIQYGRLRLVDADSCTKIVVIMKDIIDILVPA